MFQEMMPMMDRLDSNSRFLVSAASSTAASDLLQNAALQLLHIHLLTQLISYSRCSNNPYSYV